VCSEEWVDTRRTWLSTDPTCKRLNGLKPPATHTFSEL
jgi:hypothetical protein